jgi:hypothetical protein
MSVTERPDFEILVLEAWLARQIRREAAADWTRTMPGVDRANVSGWTPIRVVNNQASPSQLIKPTTYQRL